MRQILRKAMVPAVLLVMGAAAPAGAADYLVGSRPVAGAPVVEVPAGPLTLQDALVIASGVGVVTVQNTHFDDDQWEIEGRDRYGKWIQVDVDARTGEIRHVDRSII